MKTTLPFSGFYESYHSATIDEAIDTVCMDDNGDINDDLANLIYHHCDFNAVRLNYAKEYCAAFSKHFNVALSFESIKSPREYNFSTDVIYCDISLDEVKRLFDSCDKAELSKFIENKFASYEGFISHYSNDLDDWGDIESFDHNQIGAIIEFLYDTENCWHGFVEGLNFDWKIQDWIMDAMPEKEKQEFNEIESGL
jgi:hypothetical protein